MNEQQLRREVDKLQTELRIEQERRANIHGELLSTSAMARAAPELETRLNDIARENVILKETNDKLTQSAFDVDRERGTVDRETSYKIQIQQLESTLKADVGEKNSILEKLTEERTEGDRIRKELKDERLKNAQLKHDFENLQDRMKIFSRASSVDFDELGEALMLIRERKRANLHLSKESSAAVGLGSVGSDGANKDWKNQYENLEIVQAETVNELERTRAILSVQYRINKDYAQEVEATTKRLETLQTDSEARLQEYAKLLDLRLARIRKLEARLRDLAYGVRPLRPMSVVTPAGFDNEQKELEAGQNLFEIHLDALRISSDTLRILGEAETVVFCTWGFFEFELQKSPVVKSFNGTALFDCTSQYIVTVDDFFLSYLAHRPLIIELHRSKGGLEYETIAAAKITLKELLDSQEPTCRMAGTVPFTGVSGALEAIQVAELDFWVLLRIPMQHAFRLFRERLKAMNYLVSDAKSRDAAMAAMESAKVSNEDNVNVLHVHVIRCQNLQTMAQQPDTSKRMPSAFVAYKFLDFAEHVTATVPESTAPQFNDHHTFTLYTTADTDRFLKTESLHLFVFDDVPDASDATAYLGHAKVPLIQLSNNSPVQGLFELTRSDGTACGVIEVRLSWQYPYKAPSNISFIQPSIGPDGEIPEVPVRDVEGQNAPSRPVQRPQTSVLLGKTVQTHQAQAEMPTPKANLEQPSKVDAHAAPAPQAPPVSHANISDDIPVPAPQTVQPLLALLPPPTVPAIEPPPVVQVQEPPLPKVVEPKAPSPPQAVESAKSESGSQPEVVFESDSEGVVVETSRLPKSVRQSLDQVISVTIHSLRIQPDSCIGKDDNITQLFVAFDFGTISQDELETPVSLTKPSTETELIFNFSKLIPVSGVKNSENRSFLASLLDARGSDNRMSSIVFSVVSESKDKDECDDVAEALVDVHDMVKGGDIKEKEFDVRALSDNSVVGKLKLTVIGADVLKAIQQEGNIKPSPNEAQSPSSPVV